MQWDDRDPLTGAVGVREGLRSMVDFGIAAAGKDPGIVVRFECWSEAEANYVKEIMAKHPAVKFRTVYYQPGGKL